MVNPVLMQLALCARIKLIARNFIMQTQQKIIVFTLTSVVFAKSTFQIPH